MERCDQPFYSYLEVVNRWQSNASAAIEKLLVLEKQTRQVCAPPNLRVLNRY